MSVSPVQNPVVESAAPYSQPADRKAQPDPRASKPTPTFPPDAGNVSKQEAQTAHGSFVTTQLPEDEVELQHDSELENELIVRYVDGSGNLIVQVPSGQMLSVQQGIMQEFQRAQARSSASAKNAGPEGESHGH